MTIQELQLLVDGFAIGAYSMLLAQLLHTMAQERHAVRAAAHERHLQAADRYRHSLRDYQRQQRFAKRFPAGVLEVSARHIELDLRDGLDRVERAARDEGLL